MKVSAVSWKTGCNHHLADARSFAGQRVLVVGLGDVAMETAIALSQQPGTHLARTMDALEHAMAHGGIQKGSILASRTGFILDSGEASGREM